MINKLQKRKESGFTIIEVLIVLAIAGLIMVVVFLAVPNLQRSQRNNARKTDANNLLENLSEYVSNANGKLPSAACSGIGSGTGQCSWINYSPDQLTAVSYATSIPVTTPDKTTAVLISGAICNGVVPTTSGATTRDYVIYYGIEGSTATVCTKGS